MKTLSQLEQTRMRKHIRTAREAALRIEKNLQGVEQRILLRRRTAA